MSFLFFCQNNVLIIFPSTDSTVPLRSIKISIISVITLIKKLMRPLRLCVRHNNHVD